MKKIFVLSAICAISLAVSCQPKEAVIETPIQNHSDASVIHTFTCTFAQPDSKFSIANDGKTSWEVGDEIMIHGGTNGASRLKITLTSTDISADGKQATISFSEDDLAPYDRTDVVSKYYAQYPASSVPSGNMYYECCFINTNHILMAACDVDDSFVFYNVSSVLSYTVEDGFDKVIFFGNNGERVGYDYYQVRIRNNNGGMEVNYHKPGNGFKTYNEQNIIEDDSISADGSTVNYLCFPNGANFSKGFSFIFYKNGEAVKTVSTKSAVNLAVNDFLPLGDLSSHLKDYKPTYTVVGEEKAVFGSQWNTFAADNVMTDNGDGTYSKTYNVPAGTYHFKIVRDHSYNFGQWPYDSNQEYYASASGALTIIFTPATNTISFGPFVEAATYTVAGTANLFGTEWDKADSNNDMTIQTDGTYVWSKEVTSAMDIEFKIVKNHDWNTSWPGNNDSYSIPAAGTMYIYFNPVNGDITKVFKVKVTIDGDMSEWELIDTKVDGINDYYLEFKATYDADNLYFYTKRNWRVDLWEEKAYVYYYFADSDSSTGSRATNLDPSVTDIDYYLYFYPFTGTSDSPSFPSSNPSGGGSIIRTNLTLAGKTDGSTTVEIEVCIPRTDAHVISGEIYKIYTYASKNGGDMNHQYISLTLND